MFLSDNNTIKEVLLFPAMKPEKRGGCGRRRGGKEEAGGVITAARGKSRCLRMLVRNIKRLQMLLSLSLSLSLSPERLARVSPAASSSSFCVPFACLTAIELKAMDPSAWLYGSGPPRHTNTDVALEGDRKGSPWTAPREAHETTPAAPGSPAAPEHLTFLAGKQACSVASHSHNHICHTIGWGFPPNAPIRSSQIDSDEFHSRICAESWMA